jgi:N-acetyl-gamma-glutamyl-phosphate reductase
MIRVGIVGGTGYTGVELLRLLAQHPQVEVAVITSRSEAGVRVVDMYPNLRGHYDNLAFSVPDSATLGACDAVFFATPHGVAHALAGELLAAGTRVIDLSAWRMSRNGPLGMASPMARLNCSAKPSMACRKSIVNRSAMRG